MKLTKSLDAWSLVRRDILPVAFVARFYEDPGLKLFPVAASIGREFAVYLHLSSIFLFNQRLYTVSESRGKSFAPRWSFILREVVISDVRCLDVIVSRIVNIYCVKLASLDMERMRV